MKIKLHEITIGEIAEGYRNNQEEGVIGYDGRLNIRPKYQREFIYKDPQRDAVIDTVKRGFPLNVMYWVKTSDGSFEVLDGQQRTISICEYVNGRGDGTGTFSINHLKFENLPDDLQKQILDYRLMIYICEGEDSEKLDWFRTINIAGEKLTDQELRNAVYTGEWLTDAKRYFSKTGCPAFGLGKDYLAGSPIRQDFLETTLDWLSDGKIEEYMSSHQHDSDANLLWVYFQSVIAWVKMLFIEYRKEMKGIAWGRLYNAYKNNSYNTNELERCTAKLMQDDDVTNKKGIYEYLLSGQEKYLNIRAFSDNMKREAYEKQKGICAKCEKHFEIEQMEADHITPWSQGGKTNADNCKMLCRECNRRKSDK